MTNSPSDLTTDRLWQIDPPKTANACIIWMHGLGATAHDFDSIIPQLTLDSTLQIRFIFPQAPVRPVTINQGYAMPAWFDVFGMQRDAEQDRPGILNSAVQVEAIIQQQIAAGFVSQRIMLAGFSQGGAVALHCALHSKLGLGGVIALSSFLPLADELNSTEITQALSCPIFMAHGNKDDILSYELGKLSSDKLIQMGYKVDWHQYSISHELCLPEINDLSQWLNRQWAASSA